MSWHKENAHPPPNTWPGKTWIKCIFLSTDNLVKRPKLHIGAITVNCKFIYANPKKSFSIKSLTKFNRFNRYIHLISKEH